MRLNRPVTFGTSGKDAGNNPKGFLVTAPERPELSGEIREAVSRVVGEFRIAGLYSVSGATWRLASCSRQEADDSERRLIDDLVLAVGEVLAREVE